MKNEKLWKCLSLAINGAAMAATAAFFVQIAMGSDVNFAAYAGTFAGLYWARQLVRK